MDLGGYVIHWEWFWDKGGEESPEISLSDSLLTGYRGGSLNFLVLLEEE